MAETLKAARKLFKQLVQSGRYIVTNSRRLARQVRSAVIQSKVSHDDVELDQAEIKQYLADLPSGEPWLRNNPEARASVERGLEQAASGRGRYLGTFAQYADLEIEED